MVRTTLRPNQEASLRKILELDGRLPIFSQKRTGKTRVALAAAEALNCERVLIVGFNSFLNVWEDELIVLEESGNPFHLPLEYLTDGSIRDRAMSLRDISKSGRPHMIAVNYEGWWRNHLRAAIRDWKPDMIIYDECHRLITSSTHSARFAHQIARDEKWFKHALALTATWQEGGFEDIFSIYKSVNPEVFSLDYQMFRANFCDVATHVCKSCNTLVSKLQMLPKSEPKCLGDWHKGYFVPIKGDQIIGYKNTQYLFDTIKKTSVRILQSDVNIYPPKNVIIPVELTAGTRQQYNSFMKNHVHNFNTNDDNLEVFARIELSALVKAQELTGGWVQDQDGHVLDISREKLDSISEYVKQDHRDGYQTAIYAKFIRDVQRLAIEFKVPENMTYSALAGGGKKGREQRKEIFRQLLRGNLDTFIGIGKMAAYGLNLSSCATANFYSTDYISIEFDQFDGRLQAPDKEPLHRHFVATGTVDTEIYAALAKKMSLRLSVFNEYLPDFTSIDIMGVDTKNEWEGF